MGIDALAFLWYGTKLHERYPVGSVDDEELSYEEEEKRSDDLKQRGVLLVDVPYNSIPTAYALAVPSSFHRHNWDNAPTPFELKQPTDEEIDRLRSVAKEIGWPFDESELGWYQAATMW